MTASRALLAGLDLHEGPIEYRVFEDYLELTVGEEGAEMVMTLNLSAQCVAALASVFDEVMPVLRANRGATGGGARQGGDHPHRAHDPDRRGP